MDRHKKTEQQKPVKGGKTNKEIQDQVYVIAETILRIAKSVEEALVNITAVKEVLNQITYKLNQDEFICDEEQALLELAEHWLHDEKLQSRVSINAAEIKTLNLGQIASLSNPFLSVSMENAACGSCNGAANRTKQFSVGSTQTLNEGQELDWDGNGVELADSIHSAYSGAATAFKDPYTLCSATVESTKCEDKVVPKSSSYNGIYEEEMEFTLEVEEGFYSDGSSIDDSFQDPTTHNDFSPQADSGVTNMGSTNNSTERSMSYPEDELSLQTSGNYNRDINTWDTFATVNLEEDLLSLDSNSPNNTPKFKRRIKTTVPAIALNHYSGGPDSSQLLTILPLPKTVESTKTDQVCPSIMRLRAKSVGEYNLSVTKNVNSSKSSSTPKLSTGGTSLGESSNNLSSNVSSLSRALDGSVKASCRSAVDNSSSSSQSDTTVVSTFHDDYDISSPMIPLGLRHNNYYHKSRRPVYV